MSKASQKRQSFLPQILFFSDFKPHAKLQNPTIIPSGRKLNAGERESEKSL
jgi:hypothetical protein